MIPSLHIRGRARRTTDDDVGLSSAQFRALPPEVRTKLSHGRRRVRLRREPGHQAAAPRSAQELLAEAAEARGLSVSEWLALLGDPPREIFREKGADAYLLSFQFYLERQEPVPGQDRRLIQLIAERDAGSSEPSEVDAFVRRAYDWARFEAAFAMPHGTIVQPERRELVALLRRARIGRPLRRAYEEVSALAGIVDSELEHLIPIEDLELRERMDVVRRQEEAPFIAEAREALADDVYREELQDKHGLDQVEALVRADLADLLGWLNRLRAWGIAIAIRRQFRRQDPRQARALLS